MACWCMRTESSFQPHWDRRCWTYPPRSSRHYEVPRANQNFGLVARDNQRRQADSGCMWTLSNVQTEAAQRTVVDDASSLATLGETGNLPMSLLNNYLKFKRGDVMNSYRGAICWMHESLNVVTELTCRCHVERLYLVVCEYTGWVECLVFNVTYFIRKYEGN